MELQNADVSIQKPRPWYTTNGAVLKSGFQVNGVVECTDELPMDRRKSPKAFLVLVLL